DAEGDVARRVTGIEQIDQSGDAEGCSLHLRLDSHSQPLLRRPAELGVRPCPGSPAIVPHRSTHEEVARICTETEADFTPRAHSSTHAIGNLAAHCAGLARMTAVQ